MADERDKCEGGYCHETNEGVEPHTCPFAEDVHGDEDTLCNCCDFCERECAMEI